MTTSDNPAARSHGHRPTLDGDKLYIAHDTGNEVTGIERQTGDIDFSIPADLRAEEAIATRFGDLLWVSSRGDGTVKRIDLGQPQPSRLGARRRSARVDDADAYRAHAGGQPAGNPASLGFVT